MFIVGKKLTGKCLNCLFCFLVHIVFVLFDRGWKKKVETRDDICRTSDHRSHSCCLPFYTQRRLSPSCTLRGGLRTYEEIKDMPEDFTWSCKRRYKKSYVWRDLLDDDHEYVLKGSQMRSNSNSSFDANSYLYGKKACCALSNSQQAAFQLNQNTKMNNIQISKTTSSVPVRSNLQGEQEEDDYSQWSSTINHKSHNSFFYSNLSKVNVVDNKYKHDMASSTTTSSSSSSHSSSQSQPTQPQSESIPLAGKRTKSRHLSMFRNLINCGGVEDTNDAAFVGLNPTDTRQHIIKADLRRKKREKSYIGLFGTCMNHQVQPQQCQKHTPARKNDDGEYGATKQAKNQRADSSAFRPIGGPHCSHCRKQFNPEKLHSHMKSCRGVKALSKAAAVSVENKMP